MHYLIVPGLNNSGPSHWQTFWAKSLPNASRVYQRCWDKPQKEEWIDTLDETVKQLKDDTILVSHSLGSVTTALWLLRAQERHELPANIKGAFLVAPADTDVVESISNFAPMPTGKLPVPSCIVGSENDPYMTFALPLSLGMESLCESMDIRIEDDTSEETILSALQSAMPAGIEITAVKAPVLDPKFIAFAAFDVVFEDVREPDDFYAKANELLHRDSLEFLSLLGGCAKARQKGTQKGDEGRRSARTSAVVFSDKGRRTAALAACASGRQHNKRQSGAAV